MISEALQIPMISVEKFFGSIPNPTVHIQFQKEIFFLREPRRLVRKYIPWDIVMSGGFQLIQRQAGSIGAKLALTRTLILKPGLADTTSRIRQKRLAFSAGLTSSQTIK